MVAGGGRTSEGGRLEMVDVMDVFEQSRTEVVGGQPGLKAFLDRGLALVVGQIDELVLTPETSVPPSADLVCEVTLLREYAEGGGAGGGAGGARHPYEAEVAALRVAMAGLQRRAMPDDGWELVAAGVEAHRERRRAGGKEEL